MLQADQLQKIEDFFKRYPHSVLWAGDAAEFVSLPTPLTQSTVLYTLNDPKTWQAAAQLIKYPVHLSFQQPFIHVLLHHTFVDLVTETEMFQYGKTKWSISDVYSKPQMSFPWYSTFLNPGLLLWQAKIFQPDYARKSVQMLSAFEKAFYEALDQTEVEKSLDNLMKQLRAGMSFVLAAGLLDGMFDQYLDSFKMKYKQDWNRVEHYIAHLTKENDEYFHSISKLGTISDDATLSLYLKTYGNRAFDDYELSAPRFHETPEKVRQMSQTAKIEDSRDSHDAPPFLKQNELEFIQIATQIKAMRGRFRLHLLTVINSLRQWALQVAHDAEILQEDIFFYSRQEIEQKIVLNDELVKKRKHEYERDRVTSLPLVLTTTDWKKVLSSNENSDAGSPTLKVLPVSNGEATGKVVIIHSESQPAPPKGSILVIPDSSARYSHFYAGAAAIIFCQGGMMSHGAIVAREYHIPAVSLSGRPIDIKDGEVVTVSSQQSKVFRINK